jgi:hypothetical protein
MIMKKLAVAVAALVSAVALNAQEAISLADARSSIGDCIKTPSKMTETMKKLSAEDQKAFLAEVNEAIAAMPGSNEAQAATFLNVNRAALKGAKPGNLETLVAEVFATVPAEFLPVLSEKFASDLFNRDADPTVKYSDVEYIKIASNLMVKVNARMSEVDGGAARSTFAIIMLAKASNMSGTEDGSSLNNLVNSLVGTLPSGVQDTARTDWIPSAMATGDSQSYEPILEGTGTTGVMPSSPAVVQLAGPQMLDALLGDLGSGADIVQTTLDSGRGDQPNLPTKEDQPEVAVNPTPDPEQEEPTPVVPEPTPVIPEDDDY